MNKENYLYCFFCKKCLEYQSWYKHGTHHSELFLFPEELTKYYKLESCLFHSTMKNVFKMCSKFPNEKMSKNCVVSSHYITPEQSSERQRLCGVLFDGISPYVCKFNDFFFDVETGTLIGVTDFYDKKFKDEIWQYNDSEKIQIFLKICEGILALHAENFIHGNIIDSNIVFESSKNPKIVGLINAQNIKNPSYDIIYQYSNKIIWPPEFLLGEKINEKFDVWALGILLHQILAKNRLPFENFENSKSLHVLLRKYWDDEPKAEEFIQIDYSSIDKNMKGIGELIKSSLFILYMIIFFFFIRSFDF